MPESQMSELNARARISAREELTELRAAGVHKSQGRATWLIPQTLIGPTPKNG